MKEYARVCSVTGKGMNEGWVWGNGEFYTSTEEVTITALREDPYYGSDFESMTDGEVLQFAFDNDICFWTEWEEID